MGNSPYDKQLKSLIRDVKAFNARYGTDLGIWSENQLRIDMESHSAVCVSMVEQELSDYLFIAMNRTFGFGRERLKKMLKAWEDIGRYFRSIRQGGSRYFFNGDSIDNEKYWDELNTCLQQIFEDEYQPQDVRYKCNVQLSEVNEKWKGAKLK